MKTQRICLILATILFVPFRSAASESVDERNKTCHKLGYGDQCWIELQQDLCRGNTECIFISDPTATDVDKRINPESIVRTADPEICALLETRESRAAAVLDSERIAEIYKDKLLNIKARASTSYACGDERCRSDRWYDVDINSLSKKAPDIFIWAHAVSCRNISTIDAQSLLLSNEPLPYHMKDSQKDKELKSHQLHQEMCKAVKSQGSRENIFEAQMYQRYESVLSHTVILDIEERDCDGECTKSLLASDYSIVNSQALACGWYGKAVQIQHSTTWTPRSE